MSGGLQLVVSSHSLVSGNALGGPRRGSVLLSYSFTF